MSERECVCACVSGCTIHVWHGERISCACLCVCKTMFRHRRCECRPCVRESLFNEHRPGCTCVVLISAPMYKMKATRINAVMTEKRRELMNERTDNGRADRRTDGRTDGRTDTRTRTQTQRKRKTYCRLLVLLLFQRSHTLTKNRGSSHRHYRCAFACV